LVFGCDFRVEVVQGNVLDHLFSTFVIFPHLFTTLYNFGHLPSTGDTVVLSPVFGKQAGKRFVSIFWIFLHTVLLLL